jgi:hypothetical protein
MATEDVVERAPSIPLGVWNLPPWIELILRKIRQAFLTDEEKRLLHLAEFGAATFGAPLLEATDLDDLDDRIDNILDRPDFSEFNLRVLATAHAESDEIRPIFPVTAKDIADLDIAVSDVFAQALNLAARALQCRRQLVNTIESSELNETEDIVRGVSLVSLCLDKSVPPELGLIFFAWFRADLCSLAFCEMVMSKRGVEPWLAMGIARRWLNGVQKYLRLIAPFPGVDVPVELVPQSERIDLPRVFAEHRAERQRINRLFEEAEASGLPIYPSGAFDDDD